ncbi:MAG: porin family protein [Deltaproteobacteria bacterium]|jgi:hypothetical protein|nr:porin family protein [Deltaproteobacteria bacterium]
MRHAEVERRAPRIGATWLAWIAIVASALSAHAEPGVPGAGVPESWEAGLRASYQRLSGTIVTSQVSVGTFLGYYVHPNVEPFLGVSLDFQDADAGRGSSATAVNVSAGAGARASFELAERLRPYLAFSPGLLLRTTDISGFDAEDQLDFVLSAQVGLQVELVPRVALDVGVAYDRIFSDGGEDLLTVPLGVSFFF